MDNSLVVVHEKELRVGTFLLSQGFKTEHRALKRLVKKYQKEFEEFGVTATALPNLGKKKEGRPIEEFLLNENQAMYLGTLLTNNEAVRTFKRKMIAEFARMKRVLQSLASQKQNAEWLEKRNTGKITRRQETDSIKDFVDYATKQGSGSASKYYMNISKMQNKALFVLLQEFPSLRDALNLSQLSMAECADRIVSRALREGMDKMMAYKEIYQHAKKQVETFAEIVGKTVVPAATLGIGSVEVPLLEE